MKQLRSWIPLRDDAVAALLGKLLDARHHDGVIGTEDADVLKPCGSLLLAYRKGAVDPAAGAHAWPALLRAATPTDRRHDAAAGRGPIRSGVVGWLQGRLTAFTRRDLEGWLRMQPLLRALARAFERHCPRQYAYLRDAAALHPRRVIPHTAFTTVTVNRTVPMGVHRDGGNLRGAYGVLTVIQAGDYSGSLLVWPKYRVAVDLRPGDLLVADNHEAHGNTQIEGGGERVSVVCYHHA